WNKCGCPVVGHVAMLLATALKCVLLLSLLVVETLRLGCAILLYLYKFLIQIFQYRPTWINVPIRIRIVISFLFSPIFIVVEIFIIARFIPILVIPLIIFWIKQILIQR